MNYQGKLVLITGGSSGIGFALASKFVEKQANVIICARGIDRLNDAVSQLKSKQTIKSQIISSINGDVSNYPEISQQLIKMQRDFGVPDIIINSAGIARTNFFEDLPIEIFEQVMQINYLGTVYPIRCVLPGMVTRGSGIIVNISSFVGFFVSAGYAAYAASKYALHGLSDVLRLELKPKGISVHVVFPPDTDTPQLAEERASAPVVILAMNGNVKSLSADYVASSIIKGIEKKHYSITPGFETQLLWMLTHGSGFLQRFLLDYLYKQARQQTRQKRV